VDAVALIAVVALLALVAWFVSRPLRTDMADRAQAEEEGRRADLEAAKDAKYREIRDLEMDLRTGKLSEEDWRALDRELRAEAVDILHALDRLGA
jgi:flagellar biosynthesis/type III secretory pathway M-ring protein FliF/YscJ